MADGSFNPSAISHQPSAISHLQPSSARSLARARSPAVGSGRPGRARHLTPRRTARAARACLFLLVLSLLGGRFVDEALRDPSQLLIRRLLLFERVFEHPRDVALAEQGRP